MDAEGAELVVAFIHFEAQLDQTRAHVLRCAVFVQEEALEATRATLEAGLEADQRPRTLSLLNACHSNLLVRGRLAIVPTAPKQWSRPARTALPSQLLFCNPNCCGELVCPAALSPITPFHLALFPLPKQDVHVCACAFVAVLAHCHSLCQEELGSWPVGIYPTL